MKLMALRGLMQSDADRAMPILEKMLAETNSQKSQGTRAFSSSVSRALHVRGRF